MMIDHAWLALDEGGELYVVRVERKAPMADGEVKLFPDGTRVVRPVEDEAPDCAAWQERGPMEYRIERDRVVRTRPVIDVPLADYRARRLGEVRAEAGERILAFAPLYRQANTVRALWGDDDKAREDAVQFFDRIDAIRAACADAEEDILAATTVQEVAAVVPSWPE